jgi:hypothetical protein
LEDVAAGQRQSHHIDMLNEVTATRSKSKWQLVLIFLISS